VEATWLMGIHHGSGRPVTRLLAGCISTLLNASAAGAQGGNVPDEAKAFVVHVESYFPGSGVPEQGAGIVFGAAEGILYVATAGHVVQRDTVVARDIWLRSFGGDSIRATLAHPSTDTLVDLAVLSVGTDPSRLPTWQPQSWDRQGDVRSLRSDDPVNPVGCPQGDCWRAPAPADRVVGKLDLAILFQSFFVGPGSSGGALFNGSWEVVGMVIKDAPPLATAIPIDRLLEQLRIWRYPVMLRRPSFPRSGYRTTLGVAVLLSTSSSTLGTGEARVPGGRVTMERQVLPAVTWHLTALRLAPENLAVTAGMAGVGLRLKIGRVAVDPFVEAGFGHIVGRFDVGGYYVAAPGGGNTYVPFFNRAQDDGLGVGGGMTVQVSVIPHVILEAVSGYWRFTTPENAPKLNDLFVGGGIRLGL
jgi:hypothetical protein